MVVSHGSACWTGGENRRLSALVKSSAIAARFPPNPAQHICFDPAVFLRILFTFPWISHARHSAPGAADASCISASNSTRSATSASSALNYEKGIRTFVTADVYGAGRADTLLGEALKGIARDTYCLVGIIGHDFYGGLRGGAKGYPRFTEPGLRGPEQYEEYLVMAAEKSLERCRARQVRPASCCTIPTPSATAARRCGTALRALKTARPHRPPRHRARAGQRLHARHHPLLRKVRRRHRLGDDHSQSLRALARPVCPARREEIRRQASGARRGLRRDFP